MARRAKAQADEMRILFIGLDYHTYTRSIITEMERFGASVTYVDIQPRNLLFKSLRTVAGAAYERFLSRHLELAVRRSRGTSYDKVIFLQAHQMGVENLARLRDLQKQAEFVLYNWDSLSNHDYLQQAPFFDRVLTFDKRDASNHGFTYLPLFCQRGMQGLRRDRAHENTIFMVGNIVKLRRYLAVNEFRRYCSESGCVFNQHLKISPPVWLSFVRQGVFPQGTTLRAISAHAFRNMVELSCAAFDYSNHDQSGQTMRVMESLCAGKKIITNSAWVKTEPFYTKDRIHVFNGLDFSGVAEFLAEPLEDKNSTFPEYYIQSFVRTLIGT